MTTAKARIWKVFMCENNHIASGIAVLKSTTGYRCKQCGKHLSDITHTPVGQAYFAMGRPDLSAPPPPQPKV